MIITIVPTYQPIQRVKNQKRVNKANKTNKKNNKRKKIRSNKIKILKIKSNKQLNRNKTDQFKSQDNILIFKISEILNSISIK